MAAVVQDLQGHAAEPSGGIGTSAWFQNALHGYVAVVAGRPQVQFQVCRVMFKQHVGSCDTPSLQQRTDCSHSGLKSKGEWLLGRRLRGAQV